MELNGIKNIIFDLGGVLLNLDYQLTKNEFIKLGVKDYDNHFTQAEQIDLFDLYETGKISEIYFHKEIKLLTGISAPTEEIIYAWNAMLLDFPPERKLLLLNLKKHFSISLLSNTNETHIKAFNQIIKKDINEESLKSLFNTAYYSNEIGYRKPDAEAFKFVLEQNNYVAEETLFLDDSIQHVEGAKRCGIRAILVKEKPVEELFADFLT
jgi:FMN phosphatase YigB (HAD superfamily)